MVFLVEMCPLTWTQFAFLLSFQLNWRNRCSCNWSKNREIQTRECWTNNQFWSSKGALKWDPGSCLFGSSFIISLNFSVEVLFVQAEELAAALKAERKGHSLQTDVTDLVSHLAFLGEYDFLDALYSNLSLNINVHARIISFF